MTHPPFFDNKASIVKDDLVSTIRSGDRVSVAAEVFSMYAYQELREQLDGLDEFRFIFTSQAFTKSRPPKQEREFYIPRLAREKGLCGTQLEIRLRNELTQKSVASECARWIRRKAKLRIPYSAKIEERELGGRGCFLVDGNRLVACFDTEVGTETIEEMARLEPDYAVMRDASMRDDATQANFEELFKTYSPDTVRRVI